MLFNPKYQPLVFAFFMALIMSFLMSGVISVINLGVPDNFLTIWFHAWWSAFVIAFPIVLFVAPMVRKITAKLIRTA